MHYIDINHNLKYNNLERINNIKTENIYQPINYPSLIDALSYYIGIHDMLLLSSVNKSIRTVISKNFMTIVNKQSKYLQISDCIENQCMKCYKFLKHKHNEYQLIPIFKTGLVKFLNEYESVKNLKITDKHIFNQCVILCKNSYFLQKIVDNNDITIDNDILKSLSYNVFNTNILRKITNIDKERYLILLPIYYHYECIYLINIYIDYIDNSDILTVLNLLSKSNKNINTVLLNRLLKVIDFEKISTIQQNMILTFVSKYYDYEIINLIAKYKTILSNQQKLIIIEIIYKCNYIVGIAEWDLKFLDETEEYNKLSIELSQKYFISDGYTSKMSNKSIIKLLVSKGYNEQKYIEQIKNLSEKDVKLLENIDIDFYKKLYNSSLKHLYLLNVSEKFNLKLMEAIYANGDSHNYQFLGKNKEYNLLSIKLATKYNKAYIFVNHLTFDDKIEMIKKYKEYINVVKIIVYHLKMNDIKNIPYTFYPTIYQKTTMDENEIERCEYYKISLNNLKNDNDWMFEGIIPYHNVVYQLYKEVLNKYNKNINPKEFNYLLTQVNFIVNHKDFKDIDTHIVLILLKIYINNKYIIESILKHPFF